MLRSSAALLLSLIGTVAFVTGACADTWIVHPDGTGDAPTIHEAVAAAAPGDTVRVTAGTHTGCL